jgi:hypothetical protein
MTKLLLIMIPFPLITSALAVAEPQLNLVIAVDLTPSVAVHAPGRPSEFQKNIEAVTSLLAQVPADSGITVIGITDQSFAEPDILLSATLPDDPGYFAERMTAARNDLVRAWQSRSQRLQPNLPRSDILGALLLASQQFSESVATRHKVLVIFSDMRHFTLDLSLDTPSGVARFSRMLSQGKVSVADIRSADVYLLGVDATNKSISF